MNGMHDLGGMTCFGPVRREEGEPVFHANWERRTFAMNIAALAFLGPVDRARHAIERMDPVEYLSTSYYEHWLVALVTLAKDLGYASDEEIETGRAVAFKPTPFPAPDAAAVEGLVRHGMPATRDGRRATPVFGAGDTVRARNIEVIGHTRLPRYVRGRVGVVAAHRGSHVFPDTAAHDRGENAHPLYTVRFEAQELWGSNVTRRDCVYIDLWEDYLEPSADGSRI
jgi:nitrile hydratase subunit beta